MINAIIQHFAVLPVKDPVAIVKHFWYEMVPQSNLEEWSNPDMKAIFYLFIFLELKNNLKAYIGGADEQGLSPSKPIMIELARHSLFPDVLNAEE